MTGQYNANGALRTKRNPTDAASYSVGRGGTGLSTIAQGDLLYGSAPGVLSALPKSSGIVCLSNRGLSNSPIWEPLADASHITDDFADLAWFKTHNIGSAFKDANASARFIDGSFYNLNGIQSAVSDARGNWSRFTTNTGAGNPGGYSTFGRITRLEHEPYLFVRLRTGSSVTGLRLFAGFYTFPGGTASIPNAADTQTQPCAMLRFSTSALDTGFVPLAFDGTTQTLGSQMGTVAASEEYLLGIRIYSTNPNSPGDGTMNATVFRQSTGDTFQQNFIVPSGCFNRGMGMAVLVQYISGVGRVLDIHHITWGTGQMS
jgi:hypothetical protein